MPYANSYDLRLQDLFGDGWNGFSFVRVYQDGFLILDTDMTNGSNRVVTFDIQPLVPEIIIDDVTVNENTGTVTFTATHRSIDASGPFTVNYNTVNGTAAAGSDCTASSGTLNFNGTSGDTESITITIIDDLSDEPTETYTIQFTASSDASVDFSDTATGRINDNDDPRVLNINNVTVNEADGTATFIVIHNGSNTSSGAFTVNYATQNATANAGSDYTAINGTLNFNGTSGDTETVSVNITDDTNIENLFETFQIVLSSPSDSSFDASDRGTGSIRDNDAILISDEGTVNTCSDVIFDSGGINGNFGNNQDHTVTICPDGSDKDVALSFALENTFDFLRVYSGTDTSGTLLGNFTGNTLPPNITSSDASGCLTLRFTSDNIITAAGFEANVTCIDRIDLAVTKTVDDNTPDEGFNIEYTLTVTNNGPINATNLSLTDALPLGVTYVSDDGAYNYVTGIWTIGTLNITVSVDGSTGGTTITNSITAVNADQNNNNVTADDLNESITPNVNQPPVVNVTGDQLYCPSTSQPIAETISITDPDDTSTEAVYIQISSCYVNGEDLLAFTSSHPNITATWNPVQGELRLLREVQITYRLPDIITSIFQD